MATKSDSIVTTLRAEIIDGTLPAGSRLKEEAIGARFGVSRVPIREALLQLESEGFISTEKYKGATVSARSERDVVELMQIRRGLEVLAASLAAEGHGRDEAENLRAVVERGQRAGAAGAVDELPPLILQFHEVVARASGNVELARMLEGLLRRIAWGFELEIEDRIDTSWARRREAADGVPAIEVRAAAGPHDVVRTTTVARAMPRESSALALRLHPGPTDAVLREATSARP